MHFKLELAICYEPRHLLDFFDLQMHTLDHEAYLRGENMRKLFIVAIFVLQGSQLVYAGCENPAPGYDQTYCVSKLFVESDKELNEVYGAIRKLLRNKKNKDDLKKNQLEWMKYRNSECYTKKDDGGTIYLDCNFELNKQRTKFFQDRLRECKIDKCQKSLFENKDWLKQ